MKAPSDEIYDKSTQVWVTTLSLSSFV